MACASAPIGDLGRDAWADASRGDREKTPCANPVGGGSTGQARSPTTSRQRARQAMSQHATASRPAKTPGPDHPITIEPNPNRVTVSAAGHVIADTRHALNLREATYPPVTYIPRKDVDMTLLHRTDHATYCPYKGDCAYFSIPAAGARAVNAVWTYEAPFPAVASIKDHLAFYPDRVDAIEERPAKD